MVAPVVKRVRRTNRRAAALKGWETRRMKRPGRLGDNSFDGRVIDLRLVDADPEPQHVPPKKRFLPYPSGAVFKHSVPPELLAPRSQFTGTHMPQPDDVWLTPPEMQKAIEQFDASMPKPSLWQRFLAFLRR